jgi:stress responsive alpha/beta barrel protein
MTHVFVEEFETEEDRKYYLEEEPGHKEFVKSLGGLVEKVQVIDFIPGIF